MVIPAKKIDQKYTYKHYLAWPDNERWELIDGVAYNMTPAPLRIHQEILMSLANKFYNYLEDKTCKVYVAPFDVRLPLGDVKDEDIESVVQPDIVVVCDLNKLDPKGCRGTPDLIVEILSPHTVQKDMKEKLYLYEKAGVKEYWIVHPIDRIVMVFTLSANGEYGKPIVYGDEDSIQVGIFNECIINLKEVFE
jgi:Uma2 family endonuclease